MREEEDVPIGLPCTDRSAPIAASNLAIASRRSRLMNPIGMKTSSSILISRFRKHVPRFTQTAQLLAQNCVAQRRSSGRAENQFRRRFNGMTTRNHTQPKRPAAPARNLHVNRSSSRFRITCERLSQLPVQRWVIRFPQPIANFHPLKINLSVSKIEAAEIAPRRSGRLARARYHLRCQKQRHLLV